jgi:hypothetical protein
MHGGIYSWASRRRGGVFMSGSTKEGMIDYMLHTMVAKKVGWCP